MLRTRHAHVFYFLAIALFGCSQPEPTARLPNPVFIMADDMGYGDVGVYNPDSKIPTPHMDHLAGEGIRFTDAHLADSVCTPTRYALMTGRYCWLEPHYFQNTVIVAIRNVQCPIRAYIDTMGAVQLGQ